MQTVQEQAKKLAIQFIQNEARNNGCRGPKPDGPLCVELPFSLQIRLRRWLSPQIPKPQVMGHGHLL